MNNTSFLDDLEADLGQREALKVLAAVGGQRRSIPLPRNVSGSALCREIGIEAALWIAGRFGGTDLAFPNGRSREQEARTARLAADILDAGLTNPTRSSNELAQAHGVTERHVRRVRAALVREADADGQITDLPLFAHMGSPGPRSGGK